MSYIIECMIAIFSVPFFIWVGIFIGREFGSFEKFIIYLLNKFADNLIK